MNSFLTRSLVGASTMVLLMPLMLFGQQKLAQTGMKFLNVGTDARAVAMGEAMTAVEGRSPSMFFNPAGMARQKGFVNVGLGQTKWIADITHNYATVAFSPADGEYGVLGAFLQAVDYGDLEKTIFFNNPEAYLDLGTFSPTALVIGVGYARALTDKFSIGGNVKYVTQDLGDAVIVADTNKNLTEVSNSTNVIAFDFGILYRTGFKSLNFGMTVRNFSREVRYVNEGFQLPLTFKIGLSMNVFDLIDLNHEEHAFLFVVDAEHPRDYQEQVRIGGEYTFLGQFALRGGYVFPTDEQGVSLGAGVSQPLGDLNLGIDYAYTSFGVFENVHRFSFVFSF